MTKCSKGKPGCFTVILAFLLPPLGVLVRFGCGYRFWLCLLLTLLLYIPGIIYALCTICEEPLPEHHHHEGHNHQNVVINVR